MTADFAARLEELAVRRAALLERQEQLDASPRPLAEAKTALAELIAGAAACAQPPVHYLAHRNNRDGSGLVHVLRDRMRNSTPGGVGPFEILAAAAGPSLLAWLTSELTKHYAAVPKPLTREQYDKGTGEIAAELALVDRDAADTWWAALEANVTLPPPECPIEALLGL